MSHSKQKQQAIQHDPHASLEALQQSKKAALAAKAELAEHNNLLHFHAGQEDSAQPRERTDAMSQPKVHRNDNSVRAPQEPRQQQEQSLQGMDQKENRKPQNSTQQTRNQDYSSGTGARSAEQIRPQGENDLRAKAPENRSQEAVAGEEASDAFGDLDQFFGPYQVLMNHWWDMQKSYVCLMTHWMGMACPMWMLAPEEKQNFA